MKPKWNLNTFVWADEKKLPGFGRLLGSWLNVHRNFCGGAQPDFSWEWDHRERSQIGFLANAAVLTGGISLEEWCTKKSTQGKTFQGRCDLWLRLSPPAINEDCFLESKHTHIDLSLDLIETDLKITQTVKFAREDASTLKEKKGIIVGLTFLTLFLKEKNLEVLDRKTNELITHIWNQNQKQNCFGAISAIWMGSEDFKLSREERERSYPGWENCQFGVILLAERLMLE